MGRKKKEQVESNGRVLYFLKVGDSIINIYQIFRISKPKENYGDNKRIKVEYLRATSECFEFDSESERDKEYERISKEMLM